MEKAIVLQTANEEFMRLGIRSVSMDDISSKLGISKKTLYQVVDNKKDLVGQSIENHLRLEKQLMNDISQNANDALVEMIQIGRHSVITLRNIKPAILHDLQKYYKETWMKIRAFTQGVIGERIKNNLSRGIKEGLYRKNINPEIISKLYVLKSWSLVDESNFSLNRYKMDELIRQHLLYHLSGILSEDGRRHLKKYQLF